MKETISIEQFHLLTDPLKRWPVSRAWLGYGSAIFLELGALTTGKYKSGRQHGEACIMLEWSWRVERPKSVFFGSWSHDKKIDNRLSKLERLSILDITVASRLPELVVQLSGGLWIHSFTTV